MQTVIIVIHLMIVSVLIGAVLLQKSEGGGLGMGGGAGFMSSRGTANLLDADDGDPGGGFLPDQPVAVLARRLRPQAEPRSSAPRRRRSRSRGGATPIAPPTSGGVLDTLKKVGRTAGQPAPSGPQAPRSQ